MATQQFVVIDRKTHVIVARCKTLNGARRSADRAFWVRSGGREQFLRSMRN